VGLNFRIPHTKGMWGKRKNECQGMQSFLHTLKPQRPRIQKQSSPDDFNMALAVDIQ